ncbi:Uncharacterised protein [Actinobacillus equuli]|nr:Uncharacterised protein [Actinobacillus equuli]
MPVEFWEKLPEKLRNPKAILLQSKEQQRDSNAKDVLLFVYETEQGKVAVKMDYEVKVKEAISGKKLMHKVNMVTTGSVFKDTTALYDFKLLWGALD